MKFVPAFILLSFFSITTLASNPIDEFSKTFFTLPDPPKDIVESTKVKEIREEMEGDKIKKIISGLQVKFNELNSDKIKAAEKGESENVILWMLEYNYSYFVFHRPSNFWDLEFSKIAVGFMEKFFVEYKLPLHSELMKSCKELLNVRNSVPFVVPKELKELIALIPQTGTKEENEQRIQTVVDELHKVLLNNDLWNSDGKLSWFNGQQELQELKDDIILKYREKLFKENPQKRKYSKWLDPLREFLKGDKLYQKDLFTEFSLHFMRFLLYRYLSNQNENFIVDRIFTSPHKKELKGSVQGKPCAELIKNYLVKEVQDIEKFYINTHLEENGKKNRSKLEKKGEKIMIKKFFSKAQKPSSERSESIDSGLSKVQESKPQVPPAEIIPPNVSMTQVPSSAEAKASDVPKPSPAETKPSDVSMTQVPSSVETKPSDVPKPQILPQKGPEVVSELRLQDPSQKGTAAGVSKSDSQALSIGGIGTGKTGIPKPISQTSSSKNSGVEEVRLMGAEFCYQLSFL
jgi:hypothetical protein